VVVALAVVVVFVGEVVVVDGASVSVDEPEEVDVTGALLGAVARIAGGNQSSRRRADSKFNWLTANVPRAPLDADASMVIIDTRRQDVTASVTILGKRCVVLPLRNRLSVPLLILNRFTDQNHVATYALPTNAQIRLLCERIREYFPL